MYTFAKIRNRCSVLSRTAKAETIRPSSTSASMTVVFSSSVRFGSALHFSYRIKSNIEALRWGLRTAFSSSISSRMPPSRASVSSAIPRLELAAPTMCIRISEEALPPSTGRSWHSTTLAPFRAAESAADTPETPPPATKISVFSVTRHCSSAIKRKYPLSTIESQHRILL
ncbi:hypothetical protein D3C81_1455310 [compost metagenome]